MLLERINLEADETVIAIVRKHWWIITIETIAVGFMAIAPLLLITLLPILFGSLLSPTAVEQFLSLYEAEIVFCYTGWLLILWITLANFWTDYYLDLWAITTKRVILVDQRGFFRRFISSFRLERLQDMNIEVNGIIATLLDYGTIEAQTAGGSNEKFSSPYMPKPRDIKAIIIKAAEELTERQASTIAAMRQQDGL